MVRSAATPRVSNHEATDVEKALDEETPGQAIAS
jgi:hypothetical protein